MALLSAPASSLRPFSMRPCFSCLYNVGSIISRPMPTFCGRVLLDLHSTTPHGVTTPASQLSDPDLFLFFVAIRVTPCGTRSALFYAGPLLSPYSSLRRLIVLPPRRSYSHPPSRIPCYTLSAVINICFDSLDKRSLL